MKGKRLAFCKKYSNWIVADWGTVMYSNELTLRVNRAMRILEQRPVGSNRYSSKFMVKTVKHPDSVMVFGCFSAAGHVGLYYPP
jgi:hypothetical protein